MARMAAGTRKRADGTLEKRFTIEGKRYSVYGKTVKELAEREQELRSIIRENANATNVNVTLDRYYSEWIERKRGTVKVNTLNTYRNHATRYILPEFGKKKIRNIGRKDVIAFQNEIAKNLSASSCKGVVNVLGAILADAVKDDIIAKNPAGSIPKIKTDRAKANETIHRALTVEEQAVFMQELSDSYYYPFIAMMLCTGMRCGEVAALQWGDIDKKNNVIHVRRTVTRDEDNKPIIGATTKTAAGVRDIPITENIRGVLNRQRELNSMMHTSSMTIFLAEFGGIVQNMVINQTIQRVLDRLEQKGVYIERFTSHALRDTFATRYIEGGGNMQTLKTILGHTSLAMTADLYSHVLPNTKQQEMNSIHIAI